ncbi:hypothetical protein ACWIYZ_04925 [Ursidibacter arcticus]
MNNKISWLDLWVYRMVTYINLPLGILAHLNGLLLLDNFHSDVSIRFMVIIVFLSIAFVCMHFKVRLFYWLMYPSALFTIFAFAIAIYPFLKNQNTLNFSTHQWIVFYIFVGYILTTIFILYRWKNVRILFKTKKQRKKEGIESIEVLENEDRGKYEKGRLVIFLTIAFFILSNLYLMVDLVMQNRKVSLETSVQEKQVTQLSQYPMQNVSLAPSVVNQPVKTQQEIENDKKAAFSKAMYEQIPEMNELRQDNEFIVFLENKVIDSSGKKAIDVFLESIYENNIYSLGKIREFVDEYQSLKNKTPQIKLLFSCVLTDERRVYVAEKSPVEYTYVIFAKDNQRVELTFNDTLDRVKKNSFVYTGELNFVMQNKTYKYNIVGKDSGTSLIVYNGNKYLSTHHCKANGISWYVENLPVLDVKERTITTKDDEQDRLAALKQHLLGGGMAQAQKENPDRIAGFEAAKKFLLANKGKSLEAIYSIYTEKMHSYNDFYRFNYTYQEAFKHYANPYGDYAKEILK